MISSKKLVYGKKYITPFVLVIFLFSLNSCMNKLPDTYMWPNPFGVPIVLHYRGKDAGYVAIYSSKKTNSSFPEGNNTYLIGGIRLKGKYINGNFCPAGYNANISFRTAPDILKICNHHFPLNKGYMWLDGNTIEWKNYEKIRPVYDNTPQPDDNLLTGE